MHLLTADVYSDLCFYHLWPFGELLIVLNQISFDNFGGNFSKTFETRYLALPHPPNCPTFIKKIPILLLAKQLMKKNPHAILKWNKFLYVAFLYYVIAHWLLFKINPAPRRNYFLDIYYSCDRNHRSSHRRCSIKKLFLKILQYSLGNTSVSS